MALIPVFLVILYLDFPYARCAAFGVFVVACLTDFVDGYIARHYNQVTNFGKFMDPLADKVLVMAAMCYLVEIGQMPGWCLAIVLLREFAVSGMRLVAVEQGRVIAAAWSGKGQNGLDHGLPLRDAAQRFRRVRVVRSPVQCRHRADHRLFRH